MPNIDVGFLYSGSPGSLGAQYNAFVNALPPGTSIMPPNAAASGVGNDYTQLRNAARVLIETHHVTVLVAAGGTVCAIAARDAVAASTRPQTAVVFTSVTDPVGNNLYVAGRNLTGVAGMTAELDAARLRLLHEYLWVPGGPVIEIGVLRNLDRPNAVPQWNNLQTAAGRGLHLNPGDVHAPPAPGRIKQVIQSLVALPVRGLLVTADPLFNDQRPDVLHPGQGGAPLTIPAIYQWREFVDDGGLMSFGPNLVEEYSAAGTYVSHILGGQSAADIPLYQPTKVELVINQATARALGRAIPPSLRSRAVVVGKD